MKAYKFILLLLLIVTSLNTLAQTPKSIEADLYKSYKKIDYWFGKKGDATIKADDSLSKANEVFGRKLAYYTSKYSFTIHQKFLLLEKNHVDISSSPDGLLRIYSWDTETGGTMHFFENVLQYKTGKTTISTLQKPMADENIFPDYYKIYLFKANDRTYYLSVYIVVGSTKILGDGLQIFAVENGKLNEDVKLIKTPSGMHSKLNYDYDDSFENWKAEPEISFDEVTKTIKLPLIALNGKSTHRYITYKFNGQYFEKVKN
jgi:hypothetical protein